MVKKKNTLIMNLELLNRHNSDGCPACGHKFTLGDPVVVACGAWDGGPKLIHEREAEFDRVSGEYVERRCYSARKGSLPM